MEIHGLVCSGKSQPETMDFPIKYGAFLENFLLNSAIGKRDHHPRIVAGKNVSQHQQAVANLFDILQAISLNSILYISIGEEQIKLW